ncbi:MAG: glycosyltransferase [Cytophaga sp.]|uniref:glycosyltransferase n=1 Tax=Cytophaga sp. TaxID=29535 RepID=UPI003F7F3501
MDKISVVIPVYNGEAFLFACLQSVVQQSCSNIEVIISIDHSSDQSLRIIQSFQHDSRIVVIENDKSNRGIFGNLNNAIRHSTGKYIQIFCQDDVMYPNMLKEQIQALESCKGAKMVYCKKDAIDAKGNKIVLQEKTWTTPDILYPEDARCYFFSYGCLPGNLSTVMLHRDCIERYGYFNQQLVYAGDFEYWIRIAGNDPIVVNKQTLLAVRQHNQRGSKTLNTNLVLLEEEISIYNDLMNAAYTGKKKKEALRYITRIRGVQHVHMFIKMLLSGNVKNMRRNIRKFKSPFSFTKVLWYYVTTLNMRINVNRKLVK